MSESLPTQTRTEERTIQINRVAHALAQIREASYHPGPPTSAEVRVACYVHQEVIAPALAVLQERTEEAEARLAAVRREHWQTLDTFGGKLQPCCGRCRHGDGAPMLWPCPTLVAAGPGAADPPPKCICDGGAYIEHMKPGWRPFVVNVECTYHGFPVGAADPKPQPAADPWCRCDGTEHFPHYDRPVAADLPTLQRKD